MNIAMVAQPIDRFPPETGSIGIWVQELGERLSSHNNVIIYGRLRNDLSNIDISTTLKYVNIDAYIEDKVSYRLKRLDRLFTRYTTRKIYIFYRFYYYRSYYYRNYIRKICQHLAKDTPDVIIVPNFSQFIHPLRHYCKKSNIILVMQCDWLIEMNRKIIERRLNKVNAICGCSSYIANNIKDYFPAIQHKTSVLYNASNVTLFKSDEQNRGEAQRLRKRMNLENAHVLLYVGRIEPEKGLHLLLRAMGRILSILPNTVLLIIGSVSSQPPSYRFLKRNRRGLDQFERIRSRYGTYLNSLMNDYTDNIIHLGKVPHYELPIYYNLADMFVHPAIWNEPFGMVITEAMACSCPVVSTKVGGIKEIVVHGETGYLAVPNSIESLQHAIITGLNNHNHLKQMGLNARKRVEENFTWEHTYSRLRDIIYDLT